VLRTTNPRVTLWESILPQWAAGLPAELEVVDRLADDPVFFELYRAHLHLVLGRPSVPVETYLRMMFLQFRYHLSFEVLCREVADSMSWRRFCRINLGDRVPDATTLMKTTKRCRPEAVEGLNEAL
jgi:IS5 family transposase